MNLINVQGNIYLDGRLVGSPGQDYLKAKQFGSTTAVDLVIVAAAHAGSDDIVLAGLDYRTWRVNGVAYESVSALVTAMNAILVADYALPDSTVLPEGIELPAKVVASNVQSFGDSEDGDLYLLGSDLKYNTP